MTALYDLPAREQWEADIRRLEEIEQEGRAGYALAYGPNGAPLRSRIVRARDLLRSDPSLTEEQRRDLRAVVDREDEARANITNGLTAFKENDRRVTAFQTEHHASFVAWAEEEYVARAVETAEALAPVLAQYLEAYDEAAAAYGSFERATVAVIAARDEAGGMYRATDTIRAESKVPPCPLPPNATELIRAILPRPRIFGD